MKPLERLDIRSLKHLCLLLKTNQGEIDKICINLHKYYYKKLVSRNNKIRTCYPSLGRLKEIQKSLNKLLQRLKMPSYLHGGIKGRSIITNAIAHVGKPMVLGLDIKDFFPSVTPHQVYKMYKIKLGCACEVAETLTCLTTFKGQIPQGAPTSAIVAVLVSANLSKRLSKLASTHRASYSQYIDDVTMSGPRYLHKLYNTISKIVEDEGFKINLKKKKQGWIMPAGSEQRVTGLNVNNRLDLSEKFKADIDSAITGFLEKLLCQRPKLTTELISIKGKLSFAHSVNPAFARIQHRRLAKHICTAAAESSA